MASLGAAALEPAVITFERDHVFVGPKTKNARCKTCRRGQHFIEHLGYPEPLDNDSGTDPMKWQTQKVAWQEAFGEGLHLSGMPRGRLESVQVIVKYTFDDRQRRDRDNLVYPFCKFLGDTLVRGRYWTLPFEAIDWTDGGMIPSEKTGKPLKSHRRLLEHPASALYGRPDAWLEGRTFKEGEPVTVRDPLGGWIPDDRWDRFEVIEMQAVYEAGRQALEIMLLPSDVEPGPWPPAAETDDLQLAM